jgi:hypothetical protein
VSSPPAPHPHAASSVCGFAAQAMSDISNANREAADCRRAAAAETNPNIARQLFLIADAWDRVIRAHEENMRRLTREKLLGVAAGWDRLAEQARKEATQT